MAILSNIKFLWSLIIVLLVLNIVSISSIWLTRERHPVERVNIRQSEGGQGHFLKEKLGFSTEQRAAFDSLFVKHRELIESQTEDIRALREQLMSLMGSSEYDKQAAEQIVQQIGEYQAELELMNYRHFTDILNICNEQQKEKFLNFLERAVGPRHPGRGHGQRPWERRRRN